MVERVKAAAAGGPRPLHWNGPLVVLGFEEFVVVLPETTPVPREEAVSLADLADERWVLFDPEHGLSDVVAYACANAGFKPGPAVQTAQVEAAARLAAAGLGPALLPANAVPAELRELAHPLRPVVGRNLACFARTGFGPLADAYIAQLAEEPWASPPDNALVVP